jgi:RNA polymerase-binding transcription factor DksA
MPRAQKATETAKQAPAKKGATAPSTAKKSSAKTATAPQKAVPASKAAKEPAKKTAAAKKTVPAKASSATATKAAKEAAPAAGKAAAAPAKSAGKTAKTAKAPAAKEPAAKQAATKPAAAKPAPKAPVDPAQAKFLEEQRALLLAEREEYVHKADELKAEADILALESEPGDIQFDEEGGEGNTSNVEREVDLVLSAQARAAVDEIDRALAKIDGGNYGICEKCGQPIPKARLKALPYAALCVQCKSGGLSRR